MRVLLRSVLLVTVIMSAVRPAAAHHVPTSAESFAFTRLLTTPNWGGAFGAMSHTGRFVAYNEVRTNPTRSDVYVRDVEAAGPELVSAAMGGGFGNGMSGLPSISRDGRFVAYASYASDLVPGDTNGGGDVFLYDRVAKTTERISVNSRGEQQIDVRLPSGNGTYPYTEMFSAISADGRFVAFSSAAPNLVEDDTNGGVDFFVRDRALGITSRVSVSSSGGQATPIKALPWGNAGRVAMSHDGRFIAFSHDAGDLVEGDENQSLDVFVHDRTTGETTMASVGIDGRPTRENGHNSFLGGLSASGDVVLFGSLNSRLVPHDIDGARNAFLRRVALGTTELVSLNPAGRPVETTSNYLSNDGNTVAWAGSKVFVRDVPGRETAALASVTAHIFALSGDGRKLLLHVTSGAVDDSLAAGLFVADRGEALQTMAAWASDQRDGALKVEGVVNAPSVLAALSEDPPGDAATVGVPEADLLGASVQFLPEEEMVVLRWDARQTSLPGPPASMPAAAGGNVRAPAVAFGAEIVVEGNRFVVVQEPSRTFGRFTVHSCSARCSFHDIAEGAVGETGHEVLLTLPLSTVGAHPTAFDSVKLFSMVQTTHALFVAPEPIVLDELMLGPVALPAPTVEVALASSGGTWGDYARATLHGRTFQASFAGQAGVAHDVHVRVCAAADCVVSVIERV